RHSLGVTLMLLVVLLWTGGNFLASSVFANNTYSKPFFVTYFNSLFFIGPLIPMLLRHIQKHRHSISSFQDLLQTRVSSPHAPSPSSDLIADENEESEAFLKPDEPPTSLRGSTPSTTINMDDSLSALPILSHSRSIPKGLTLAETAHLSLRFSILWFIANYFMTACLSYTTVASSTILSSTSSIWTLILGSVIGVERFTRGKVIGVLLSLAGVGLISLVDSGGTDDESRGSFPSKTSAELAVGDVMAVFSAFCYGVYIVMLKKRVGDESRVNMPLFFGLVGLFNTTMLWPGFFILHLVGIERFDLPPTGTVWKILIANGVMSIISDFSWAYALLLTSPLLVTVGLNLTIPVSLVGQIIIHGQSSGFVYWIGAIIVFFSFILVNREEVEEEEE
ncbi:hypothetical protein M501DRAFT_924037, partial [Patellaria atrata CBS 101060]